jgi:hypothetical protein
MTTTTTQGLINHLVNVNIQDNSTVNLNMTRSKPNTYQCK